MAKKEAGKKNLVQKENETKVSAEENGESKRTSRKRPLPAELPSPPEERETLKTKPQNKRNRKQNLSQENILNVIDKDELKKRAAKV